MIHRRDLGSNVASYPTRAEMGHHCVLNEWHSIHEIDAFLYCFFARAADFVRSAQ